MTVVVKGRKSTISTGLHEVEVGSTPHMKPNGALRALQAVVGWTRITPNVLTAIGFAGVIASGALIVQRQWFWAGVLYVLFSLFDSLDGTLARYQGTASRFGAFLDSTLDRAAEGVILAALGITLGQEGSQWALGACFVALTASFLVSYSRARSEGLGIDSNKGGLMGRPERLVLTGLAIFMAPLGSVLEVCILVLAVLSSMTAIQRVIHVRDALASSDAGPAFEPGPTTTDQERHAQ